MNAYTTALHRALHRFARPFRSAVLVLFTALGTWGIAQAAATGPANLPMLSSAKGAAPNVMLTLDNSGSMDWKVLDTYPSIDAGRKSSNGSSFTEYTNWKCSTGYSGPIQDRDGRYYCIQTTTTAVCPSGYTGPKGAAGAQYCEKTTPNYSCDVGWTGPTKNPSSGKQECSQMQCPAGMTYDGVAKQCYGSYVCPSDNQLNGTQCTPYSCPNKYSIRDINASPVMCRRNKKVDVTATAGTPKAATRPQAAQQPVIKDANVVNTSAQFNNVISLDETKRIYGTAPYSSGVVTATANTVSTCSTINSGCKGTADAGGWYAMRSAQVNPLYYDPNRTYLPPVDYKGDTQAYPTLKYVLDEERSSLGKTGGTESVGVSPRGRYPSLKAVSSLGTDDGFTYTTCKTFNTSNALGSSEQWCTVGDRQPGNGGSAVTRLTKTTTTVTLPAGNRRTDCGAAPATSCTAAQEWANIYNWYSYYQKRSEATATAVGYALANPAYSGKMRVGYYNINKKNGSSNDDNDAVNTTSQQTYSAPVRPFKLGDVGATKGVFDWIAALPSKVGSSTPLHNAVSRVGDYYTKAQPYYNDTISSSSGQLSCRRSYNILFSDGAWNNWDDKYKNTPFYNESNTKPTNWGSTTKATTDFFYDKNGLAANNRAYTPYPDGSGTSSSYTLAAMTSKYYWAYDLQPSLTNDLATRPGEPTNWQNMKTYTVGYGLAPVNMSFDDISNWQKYFAKAGYQASKLPAWSAISSGDASDSSNSGEPTDRKIDDFVHAGYTGGGAGFAVFTAEDIQRVFAEILSDVVSAAGSDAGVAVSGASNTVSTIEGALKYTVDYKTLDNSGDIKAWILNANGANAENAERWSAAAKMPNYTLRNLSTLASNGSKIMLSQNKRLDSLPNDLQLAINPNLALSKDASFINYLRGDNSISSPVGALYRQRVSLIAADVNAPPAYIGGRLNMGYDRTKSGTVGKTSYAQYTTNKGKIPGTLYVPSNDGQVHVINAANDSLDPPEMITQGGTVVDPGKELWSYLIRGALPKMEKFADAAYTFEYVLDGPVVEHDVYDSGTTSWKQMVYGSLGRGAMGGLFALNAPLNLTDKNRIPDESNYLWEVSPSYMGYATSSVTAGQASNGDWVVLASSGHYSNKGKAGLYVLNAMTGAEIRFLELPVAANAFGRGMGGVTAIRNAERKIVGAYVGDDAGNLWRFDLLDQDASQWSVMHGKPLFTAPTSQPIYAAAAWSAHPGDGVTCTASTAGAGSCGAMVVIGTGALLDNDDMQNVSKQAIYGIWDPAPIGQPETPAAAAAFITITPANLVEQTITLSKTDGAGSSVGREFYQSSQNKVDWKKDKGWMMKLGALPNTTGERVIADPFNLGSNVFVSSVIVGNSAANNNTETCTVRSSPPNVLYGLDVLTGSMKRAFDQNGDGRPDQFSIAYIAGGGFTRGSVITQVASKDPNSTAGIGLPTEGDADLAVKEKCTGEQGFNTGITGSMQVFDGCPAGWKRSWRQVLNPPTL